MKHHLGLAAVALAATLGSAPALAAANLIVNGSFETGDFTGFTHSNANNDSPAVVLVYNNAAGYGQGGGAFGEAVTPDNATTLSTDAVGTHAAYFSSDLASAESISQLTPLNVGNYEVGFDAYLPLNGTQNPFDAHFSGQIIGINVATFSASAVPLAQHWYHFSGVAGVSAAGFYRTSFTFSADGAPAKDVVIDRVYAIPTLSPSTVVIPATPTAPLPEPAVWGLMVGGFGLVGASLRRRGIKVVAV